MILDATKLKATIEVPRDVQRASRNAVRQQQRSVKDITLLADEAALTSLLDMMEILAYEEKEVNGETVLVSKCDPKIRAKYNIEFYRSYQKRQQDAKFIQQPIIQVVIRGDDVSLAQKTALEMDKHYINTTAVPLEIEAPREE